MATGTPPGSFYNPDPMVGQEDPALSAPSVDMPPQQQPSGGGIIEQAVATGAVPRSRRRLSAQAPDYGYRMTNEDFYPNQGVQVFRSTPGEYGNIPIPIASPSRVAMAPLAARGQQLRRKQEELDAQVAQLDTLGTGLDKAPPPYQKGMDQLWDAEFTGLVDTWTGATGSRSAAMREFATPGSEANQQLMRLRRNFNTMTGQGVNTFNKATALRAAVDANQWVSDPKTYEMAKDIEAGMVGISQNNYKRLVSLMEPFEARLSVYEFLNKMEADKSAAIAMQEIQETPRRSGPYDVQAQHRKLEDFREQLIKQYMAYSGGRIQEEDVREIVEGRYPDSELIQWNRVPQGSRSGSSSKPEVVMAWQKTPVSTINKSGKLSKARTYNEMPMPSIKQPIELSGESGKSYYMDNISILDDGTGEGLYIKGTVRGSDKNIQAVQENRKTWIDEATGDEITEAEFIQRAPNGGVKEVEQVTKYYEVMGDGTRKPVSAVDARKDMGEQIVPYKYNDAAIESAFGVSRDALMSSRSVGLSPPVPGAKKAPDGKWYVMKDGKWFRVDQ